MSDDEPELFGESQEEKEDKNGDSIEALISGFETGANKGRKVGTAIGAGIASLIASVIFVFGGLLVAIVPYGSSLWKTLAKRSIEKYHRKSGADAVAFNHLPNGQIRLEAVKYTEGDPDEQKRPGWQAAGRDKTWTASADGREVDRLGKAPVVLLDESSQHRATVVEARVSEALDWGDYDILYEADQINIPVTGEIEVNAQGGAGEALADGGQINWTPEPPELRDVVDSDAIVDISPEDGHEGQQISLRRVKETYREKGDAEVLQNVETAAFLAGRSSKDFKSFAIKIILIAGAIALAGLIGPELIAALFGSGGGGGGGSTIPLSISPFLGG